MNTKQKNYAKYLVIALNCLAIAFMVYVMTKSASYTVLLGDDFVHGVQVEAFHVPLFQYFAASLRYMKRMYMTWQGTYFAMFLQAFLSPINNFGMPQLRAVMVGNALFFFASLFGMVWAAFRLVIKEKKTPCLWLTCYSIILFSILDADIFTEIFFWFSGAVAYSMPFSVLLLAVMFFLLSNQKEITDRKKTVFAVCAAVLLFLAAGGSLTVTGTGCYVVLLLTVGFYLMDKRVSVRNIIVTITGVIGALIAVAAPGNYERHTEIAEGYPLLQCIKWTIRTFLEEIERLTKETMFGVIMLVVVIIGVWLAGKFEILLKEYGVFTALALVTGLVTVFPVSFGYGGPYFPNRCYFILDVVLVLSFLNLALFAGCCLERWCHFYEKKDQLAILLFVCVAAFLNCEESFSDSALFQVRHSMRTAYPDYYQECVAIYDYLETCPEDDVVLEPPSYIDNFECFYLDEDADSWVNAGMARYYHKNSVKRKSD